MNSSKNRGAVRFTLRELLLFVTVTALVVGLVVMSRRARRAESELSNLREEVGHVLGRLNVDDPTQVYVRALDADEPNTWRWRMFVPKGHRYALKAAHSNIPGDGVPQHGMGGYSNEPYWETDNEVLVTARLRQGDDGEWHLTVDSMIANSRNQMSGISLPIPDDAMQWTREISSVNIRHLGGKGQVAVDPKGPIILLQRRPNKQMPDGSDQPSPEPMPGYVIWLEKY